MRNRDVMTRLAAIAAGAIVLMGVAGAAAADDQFGDEDVDLNVTVTPLVEPGVLAMTVAGTSVDLTEQGSTELTRQFVGELPTVTVTDTRAADEIPAGAFWYVLGSASDFVSAGTQSAIGAEYLGWTPQLIDGGESGLVAEGDPVEGEKDGGPGLVDQELLAMAFDSGSIASEGSWTATADLALKIPATTAPGSYTSVLTLSLFE